MISGITNPARLLGFGWWRVGRNRQFVLVSGSDFEWIPLLEGFEVRDEVVHAGFRQVGECCEHYVGEAFDNYSSWLTDGLFDVGIVGPGSDTGKPGSDYRIGAC